MLVVHKIVAQPGATVRDAAIGELEVERAESRRDVADEKAVEEAYRRVSGLFSMDISLKQRGHTSTLVVDQKRR